MMMMTMTMMTVEEENEEKEKVIFLSALVRVIRLYTLPKELYRSKSYPRNPEINKIQLNFVTCYQRMQGGFAR